MMLINEYFSENIMQRFVAISCKTESTPRQVSSVLQSLNGEPGQIYFQENAEHATYVWPASQDPANDPVAQFDEGKPVWLAFFLVSCCEIPTRIFHIP